MSHDIFVQELPAGIKSVEEIPDGFVPRQICSRTEVIRTILEIFPKAEFPDPTWGQISDLPGFQIEVSLGDSEMIEGFTFHVSGGTDAVRGISQVLRKLGLQALDPHSESGLFQCID